MLIYNLDKGRKKSCLQVNTTSALDLQLGRFYPRVVMMLLRMFQAYLQFQSTLGKVVLAEINKPGCCLRHCNLIWSIIVVFFNSRCKNKYLIPITNVVCLCYKKCLFIKTNWIKLYDISMFCFCDNVKMCYSSLVFLVPCHQQYTLKCNYKYHEFLSIRWVYMFRQWYYIADTF